MELQMLGNNPEDPLDLDVNTDGDFMKLTRNRVRFNRIIMLNLVYITQLEDLCNVCHH